jgi:hypothetical protein
VYPQGAYDLDVTGPGTQWKYYGIIILFVIFSGVIEIPNCNKKHAGIFPQTTIKPIAQMITTKIFKIPDVRKQKIPDI